MFDTLFIFYNFSRKGKRGPTCISMSGVGERIQMYIENKIKWKHENQWKHIVWLSTTSGVSQLEAEGIPLVWKTIYGLFG